MSTIYHVEPVDEAVAPGRYCVVDHHGGVLVELSTVDGGTMSTEQMDRLCSVLNANQGFVLNGRPRVTTYKVEEARNEAHDAAGPYLSLAEPLSEASKTDLLAGGIPCQYWPACNEMAALFRGEFAYCRGCDPQDPHAVCRDRPVFDDSMRDHVGAVVRAVWVDFAWEQARKALAVCTCSTVFNFERHAHLVPCPANSQAGARALCKCSVLVEHLFHADGCPGKTIAPRAGHLDPYDALDEPSKEVDRRIGVVLATWGWEQRTRQVCTLASRHVRDLEEGEAYADGYRTYAAEAKGRIQGYGTPSPTARERGLYDDDPRLGGAWDAGYRGAAIEHELCFSVGKWAEAGGVPPDLVAQAIKRLVDDNKRWRETLLDVDTTTRGQIEALRKNVWHGRLAHELGRRAMSGYEALISTEPAHVAELITVLRDYMAEGVNRDALYQEVRAQVAQQFADAVGVPEAVRIDPRRPAWVNVVDFLHRLLDDTAWVKHIRLPGRERLTAPAPPLYRVAMSIAERRAVIAKAGMPEMQDAILALLPTETEDRVSVHQVATAAGITEALARETIDQLTTTGRASKVPDTDPPCFVRRAVPV